MGRNNYFQFKQFRINQEKSAMKVGTDGVLLGAWTNISGAKSILDIGSGTGLISLMMAQRSNAKITGIEIETNAASEAVENVQNSPWGNRIEINHTSFQKFARSSEKKFDLIVSNPPFFENSSKNPNQNLAVARHNDALPFFELLQGTTNLLNKNGRLSLILPVIRAEQFETLAKNKGLFLNRCLKVKPDKSKNANRYLMEFSMEKSKQHCETLIIYNTNHSDYSDAYKSLTKDFYLNF